MVRSISANNNHKISNLINKFLNFKLKLNAHRASDKRNSLGLLLPTMPSTKPLNQFQKWWPAAAGEGDEVDGGSGARFLEYSDGFRWQSTTHSSRAFPTVPSMRQTDNRWESYERLKFWRNLKKKIFRREREGELRKLRESDEEQGKKEKKTKKKKEKEKEMLLCKFRSKIHQKLYNFAQNIFSLHKKSL